MRNQLKDTQQEDLDPDANFDEEELEAKKQNLPGQDSSILEASRYFNKGQPVFIDQEALIPIEEKLTMFKCPVHNTFAEMSEACPKCKRNIYHYEATGYELETMICEVSQADLLNQIQDQH